MPYVDLHSADDYASIYYSTNSIRSNVSGFDPEKPSIIILHPLFLDSTWLDNQFGDPRLNEGFNLIAFDMRVCGRSTCRPTGRHDSWVEAADLAFCHQVRRLCLLKDFFVIAFWYFRLYIFLLAIFWHLKASPYIALFVSQSCAYLTIFISIFPFSNNWSAKRFPEMCLSLTLCNVPAPTEYVFLDGHLP